MSSNDPEYGEGFGVSDEDAIEALERGGLVGQVVDRKEPRFLELRGSGGLTAQLTPADLRNLTFEEIEKLAGRAEDSTVAIGTDQWGPVVGTKDRFIGVEFVIVYYEFQEKTAKFGTDFVTLFIQTAEPIEGMHRFILNDGSTGIADQLRLLKDKTGQNSMIRCRYGLRKSEYIKTLETSKGNVDMEATTYYIDTKL